MNSPVDSSQVHKSEGVGELDDSECPHHGTGCSRHRPTWLVGPILSTEGPAKSTLLVVGAVIGPWKQKNETAPTRDDHDCDDDGCEHESECGSEHRILDRGNYPE